jgi:hypothetical protein
MIRDLLRRRVLAGQTFTCSIPPYRRKGITDSSAGSFDLRLHSSGELEMVLGMC